MSTDEINLGRGEAVAERPMAIRVYLEATSDEHWIPKSVLHDDSEVWEDGHVGDVIVAEWWGDKLMEGRS